MPSLVVSEMKYDAEKAELLVIFVSGLKYIYMGVPEEEYTVMKTSGA